MISESLKSLIVPLARAIADDMEPKIQADVERGMERQLGDTYSHWRENVTYHVKEALDSKTKELLASKFAPAIEAMAARVAEANVRKRLAARGFEQQEADDLLRVHVEKPE